MADITMPQLGETVTEGTITKWLKNVGDRIEEDEVIYEVSTDKVDSEVPSPVAGFLTEIKVPELKALDTPAKVDAPMDSMRVAIGQVEQSTGLEFAYEGPNQVMVFRTKKAPGADAAKKK